MDLFLADRRWGSSGIHDYAAQARELVALLRA